MYLKRIELQGFKSFPDKMSIDFTKGITAIVGPNGSGKSNIADAIQWVLGEQSPKSLRGWKMEDVIFIGTKSRAGIGYASVKIVLDNSNKKIPISFSEIIVGRKLYRSGESEYFLNGSACRLKDIHELFMDTGIGKEGYSIIGQGKIDEIIGSKTDERRFLFEEAAGIVKYKNRKHESTVRLEKERQNLLRVNDIINELETKVTTLKKEAESSKQYLTYYEKLKLIDINIFLNEVENLKLNIKKITNHILSINSEVTILEEEKSYTLNQISTLNKELLETEDLIKSIEKKYNDKIITKQQNINDNKLLKEQLLNINSNVERLKSEDKQNHELLKEIEFKIQIEEENKNLFQLEVKDIQKTLENKEDEYRLINEKLTQVEKNIEESNNDIIEKIKAKAYIVNDLNNNQNVIKELQEHEIKLQNLKSLKQNEVNIKKQLEIDVNNRILKEEKIFKSIEKDFKELNNKSEELEKEININIEEVTCTVNILNEMKAKNKILFEFKNDYEGYNKSVKSILVEGKLNRIKGICGVVGELLEVDKIYETCINVALGNKVQNIVTNTEVDAKRAIEFLKRNNLGRVTFLPISLIKESVNIKNVENILKEKGVIGLSIDLIKYNEKYKKVFYNLLGKIVVVEDIEKALRISKKYNNTLKIVTLEGEFLNIGGSITGGSTKWGINVFSKDRELKELDSKIQLYISKRDTIDKKISSLQEEDKYIKEELFLLEEKKQKMLMQLDELKQEKEKINIEVININKEIVLLEEELSETVNKLSSKENAIKYIEEQLKIIEEDINYLEENLIEQQKYLSKEKGKKDEGSMQVLEKNIEITKLNQNLQVSKEKIIELNENKIKLNERITSNRNKIEILEKDEKEKEMSVLNNQLEIEKLEIDNTEASKELEENKNKVISLKSSLENVYLDDKNLKEREFNLSKEKLRLEMKKEQLEEEKERLYNEMWDKYSITYRGATSYTGLNLKNTNLNSLKKKGREIKELIKELGTVNVKSIEEYEEVKTRYEFLINQKEDIENAEKNLLKMIDELTVLMKRQFKEQFNIISKNFNKVFKEVFGGGEASLYLLEDDDILNSTIEIQAQPPGKKLCNMSLLSGGERCLTAIALLFGILLLKPSPFCILDEVEASLDDTNVNRYAKFIKKLSENTQFIVVTHRKGTMEYSDVLYGVTMQEKGVSKVVSIKLE